MTNFLTLISDIRNFRNNVIFVTNKNFSDCLRPVNMIYCYENK